MSLLKNPALAVAFLLAFFLATLSSVFAESLSFISDPLDRTAFQYPITLKAVAEDPSDLTVFWWNTREGGAWSKKMFANPLETNLKFLIQSDYQPDVLILGEYMPGQFEPETDVALNFRYPYHLYTPYGRFRDEMGIAIYSKYPFTADQELLDWSPLFASNTEQILFKQKWRTSMNPQADKYYERPFIDIHLTKGDRLYHIVPVHLLNPWLAIADALGKTKAGLVLMFGDDNPHFRQTERLVYEKIMPLLRTVKLERSSLVLIGDFNMPDEYYGFSPKGYQLIESYLTPAVNPLFSEFTFPAISSDMTDQPVLRIDHAFVSKHVEVEENVRLPLTGSDHYPIELKVRGR